MYEGEDMWSHKAGRSCLCQTHTLPEVFPQTTATNKHQIPNYHHRWLIKLLKYDDAKHSINSNQQIHDRKRIVMYTSAVTKFFSPGWTATSPLFLIIYKLIFWIELLQKLETRPTYPPLNRKKIYINIYPKNLEWLPSEKFSHVQKKKYSQLLEKKMLVQHYHSIKKDILTMLIRSIVIFSQWLGRTWHTLQYCWPWSPCKIYVGE